MRSYIRPSLSNSINYNSKLKYLRVLAYIHASSHLFLHPSEYTHYIPFLHSSIITYNLPPFMHNYPLRTCTKSTLIPTYLPTYLPNVRSYLPNYPLIHQENVGIYVTIHLSTKRMLVPTYLSTYRPKVRWYLRNYPPIHQKYVGTYVTIHLSTKIRWYQRTYPPKYVGTNVPTHLSIKIR